MDNRSTKRKIDLIQQLIAMGFSVRRATRAVNAVFECMTRALRRGEVVEIPGGTIRARTRQGKSRPQLQKFRNVQTGKPSLKLVDYPGRRRVVKFRPDESLDLTPLPVPPTPEEIECRELAAKLLGHTVDDQSMARLQYGADFPQPRPGALLRRLREVRSRGRRPAGVEDLTAAVANLYWI